MKWLPKEKEGLGKSGHNAFHFSLSLVTHFPKPTQAPVHDVGKEQTGGWVYLLTIPTFLSPTFTRFFWKCHRTVWSQAFSIPYLKNQTVRHERQLRNERR